MRAIESLLHEKCQDRDEPTEEEINSYINEEEQFLPPYVLEEREGAPRITSANCISLLHM